MSESPDVLTDHLPMPPKATVEQFIDEMRHWSDGFISPAAFAVAAVHWPQVRELALAEWRQCLADPDCDAMDSQLPVLGFYLAAANRDAGFLAPMLDGWHKDDDTRERLFGDILLQDGAALWARMAEHSPEAIRLLEEASVSCIAIEALECTCPLEALALLVKHGVYERSSFDVVVRRCIDSFDKLEGEPRNERRDWLAVLLADCGPGIFVDEVRGWLSTPQPNKKKGLLDMAIIDLPAFEELIAQDSSEKHWHAWERFHEVAEDAWIAMEWMRREADGGDEEADDEFSPDYSGYDDLPNEPIVRVDPKIGRNDPCPCGSGKKFKKCCGKHSGEA